MVITQTEEWAFDAAQTDFAIKTAGATEQIAITYVDVTCAGSNTGDVSVRLGLAAATLPTLSMNNATGNPGLAFSHGGIKPGGGAVKANGESPIAVGALGADMRVTCSAPTGGSLRLIVAFKVLTPDAGTAS